MNYIYIIFISFKNIYQKKNKLNKKLMYYIIKYSYSIYIKKKTKKKILKKINKKYYKI